MTLPMRAVAPLVLLMLAFLPRGAAAQTSYPLVCRGGPAMRIAPDITVGGATRLQVRFARGTRGAVLGVDPGTCAWQDRGINGSEPAAICFTRVDHLSFEMNGLGMVVSLRARVWAGESAVIFWEAGERPDGVAIRLGEGQHWYFRARNDPSGGCLLITQVGP